MSRLEQTCKRYPVAVTSLVLYMVIRIIPHTVNFTPTAAMCLYGTSRLPVKLGVFMSFLAIVLSDVVIGFILMYEAWNTENVYYAFGLWTPFGYTCYAIDMLIGYYVLRNTEKYWKILVSAASASMIFFIISNFGVWLYVSSYALTLSELFRCYGEGLPFLGWQVFGDLLFSTILFGLHYYLTNMSRFASEKVSLQIPLEKNPEL